MSRGKGYNRSVGNQSANNPMTDMTPISIDPNGMDGLDELLIPVGNDQPQEDTYVDSPQMGVDPR